MKLSINSILVLALCFGVSAISADMNLRGEIRKLIKNEKSGKSGKDRKSRRVSEAKSSDRAKLEIFSKSINGTQIPIVHSINGTQSAYYLIQASY